MSVNTTELWLIEPFYIFLVARFLLFTVFHLTVEGRHLWDFFSYYDLQSPGFDGRAHNRTRWCLRVKSMCQPSPDSGLPSHPRILSSLVSSAFLGGSSVLQTGASHTAPFLTDYTNSFHTRGRTAPPPLLGYVLFMKTAVGVWGSQYLGGERKLHPQPLWLMVTHELLGKISIFAKWALGIHCKKQFWLQLSFQIITSTEHR